MKFFGEAVCDLQDLDGEPDHVASR